MQRLLGEADWDAEAERAAGVHRDSRTAESGVTGGCQSSGRWPIWHCAGQRQEQASERAVSVARPLGRSPPGLSQAL